MPANVGEMFYYGNVPWHGEGVGLEQPATLEEALRAGGLNWTVGEVDLLTTDVPPSPVPTRKAIVRLDRLAGDEGRVLGVVHRGFKPLQNQEGGLLFDAIFGQGRRVYHTGGYLGDGEVVWLLAAIDQPREIAPGDIVEPYALYTNSHDGSGAIHIRLTTVRVVCQNTLTLALGEKRVGLSFRRAHQGTFRNHAEAAQAYFAEALKRMDATMNAFVALTQKQCSKEQLVAIVEQLLPLPKPPRHPERNPGVAKAYEMKLQELRAARNAIAELSESGQGMNLKGAQGTFWGALNAVLEFVDHRKKLKGSRLAYALLGEGMALKERAFRLVQEEAAKAA